MSNLNICNLLFYYPLNHWVNPFSFFTSQKQIGKTGKLISLVYLHASST